MRIRGFSSVALATFGVLAGSLAFGGAPAFASSGFAFLSSFAPETGFGRPVGVAVDNSAGLARGSVYVSDQGRDVVDRFSGEGVLVSEVVLAGASPGQIAVDDNPGLREGDVYVVGFDNGVLYRLGTGLSGEEELVTGLEQPTGVAVDAAGNILVSVFAGNEGEGKVLEFNSSGKPVNAEGVLDANNVVAEGLNSPQALAVTTDGKELYVATHGGTLKYTLAGSVYAASGELLDTEVSSGVTIAPSGDIYVDQDESGLGEVEEYEATGVLINRMGRVLLSNSTFGVGVSSELNDVFLVDAGAGVVDVFEEGLEPEVPVGEAGITKGLTAVLNGTLAGGTTGYYFVYAQGGSCEGENSVKSTEAAATDGQVHVEVTGLQALTRYSFCLIATNRFGSTPGPSVPFETPSVKPAITEETASEVGAHSAKLSAQVNPENLSGRYYFEYRTGTGEPHRTPEASLAQNTSPVAVSAVVSGLEPGTIYYFHLVAKNSDGESAEGAEVIFRTLASAVATLPDGRVYEMVTPPENHDADVHVPTALPAGESLGEGTKTQFPFQVAADGSAVTYPADATTGGYGVGANGLGNQYVARRTSGGAWAQLNIQPPGRNASVYQGFSNNLTVGVLASGNEAEPRLGPLSAGAPGEGFSVLYTCADIAGACTTSEEAPSALDPAYQPLFGKPLNRDGGEFGTQGYGQHGEGVVSRGDIEVVPVFAGSAGDSDFLFEANDALPLGGGAVERELVEGVKREMANNEDSDYLYDSVDGTLNLVDVLPDGKVAPDATFGAAPVENSFAEFDPPDFSNVVSADGSRVYWSDLRSGVVYVRVEGLSTEQVSAGAARYWTSAADGRYAFYGEGGGLYRFDSVTEGREALTGVGAGSGLLGVIGASDDGEDVYFFAEEVLGSGVSAEGVDAVKGEPNLYLSRHGSAPVFIATLSGEDGSHMKPFNNSLNSLKGEYGDWQPGLGNRTAEVANDGSGVVFMSERSLRSVGFGGGAPNGGDEEVYLFEAGSGRLVCVSCSASGEAPPSQEGGAAAFLPISWSDTYLPQWVSSDGSRVFFDSAVPLVAQDTNGKQDVYEWEREGSGSCTSATAVNGGCVYLLSGGTSLDSWFIGASASGDDAFVVTRTQLVPEDQNDAFDLYDARVGGTIPPSPPACTGTGCQGVPAPAPTFATPPSVTFTGVGNFPPPVPARAVVKAKAKPKAKVCKRGYVKKRGKCVRRSRARVRKLSAKGRKRHA